MEEVRLPEVGWRLLLEVRPPDAGSPEHHHRQVVSTFGFCAITNHKVLLSDYLALSYLVSRYLLYTVYSCHVLHIYWILSRYYQ